MKKDGGTIINWQLHHLSAPLDKVKEMIPDFKMDEVVMFTGTVVHDPAGRFEDGWHMRSSIIVDFDKETGIVETENTIYKLEGEEGGDTFPDLGDGVMGIFY